MESESLCTSLHSYISAFFGPFVKDFTMWTTKCGDLVCSGHGQCIAQDIPAVLSFDGSETKQQKVLHHTTAN